MLAGVGLTWYTWLEQGRAINPSQQVIDSLGRALQLTRDEHEYLRGLAGYPVAAADHVDELPSHGQRVLDALGISPAYAITRDWTIVGWNAGYARLYSGVTDLEPADRNLQWLLWMDPEVRELLADWDTDVRRFLATFRAEVGGHLHEPKVMGLITRLHKHSAAFAAAWDSHDVERFTSRSRHFQHPDVGTLTLEHHQLILSDCPELRLIIYTAAPGSADEGALSELASRS